MMITLRSFKTLFTLALALVFCNSMSLAQVMNTPMPESPFPQNIIPQAGYLPSADTALVNATSRSWYKKWLDNYYRTCPGGEANWGSIRRYWNHSVRGTRIWYDPYSYGG